MTEKTEAEETRTADRAAKTKRAAAPEGESSWPAVSLMVLALVVVAYSLMYGMGTLAWIEGRRSGAANPWLYEVPQPLPPEPTPAQPAATAKGNAPPAGTQLLAYGDQLTAPWRGSFQTKDERSGTAFRFASGQIIVLFDPATEVDTVKELESLSSPQSQQFERIFAGRVPETNYDLYQAVYSASPAQLSPFLNAAKAMRLHVLLDWKLSWGLDARGGLRSFSYGANRGLEFGDPAKGPVAVRLFDAHDHQTRLFFTIAGGSGATLSQSDIAGVLASFTPPALEGE